MNTTESLLQRIKQALFDGKLSALQVPIEDIKICVRKELESNANTFTDSQFRRVMEYYENMCRDISDREMDEDKILLFLDSALLCVSMISEVIRGLASAEYWRERHQNELENPEVVEIIENIGEKGMLDVFNYDFVEMYNTMDVEILPDEKIGMYYIPCRGRKMYFPKRMGKQEILEYYRGIAGEQDKYSPHYYYKEGYYVEKGDVVVDAGVAEGNFAINIVDIAKEVYLIEADEGWVEALRQTFVEDEDKVHIIRGYLDESTEGESVSLDMLFADQEINFIKMDIEGFERAALCGADGILSRNDKIKCAVCSYHNAGDELWITDFLQKHKFETTTSRGYMCPAWSVDAYMNAELRRGLVFGRKGC